MGQPFDHEWDDRLAELFEDLARAGFRDRLGHPLENLISYQEAKAEWLLRRPAMLNRKARET